MVPMRVVDFSVLFGNFRALYMPKPETRSTLTPSILGSIEHSNNFSFLKKRQSSSVVLMCSSLGWFLSVVRGWHFGTSFYHYPGNILYLPSMLNSMFPLAWVFLWPFLIYFLFLMKYILPLFDDEEYLRSIVFRAWIFKIFLHFILLHDWKFGR